MRDAATPSTRATNQSTRLEGSNLGTQVPSPSDEICASTRDGHAGHTAHAQREEGVRAVDGAGVLWDRQTTMGGRGGAGAACLQRLDGLAAA